MLNKVMKTVEEYGMLDRKDFVMAAVSGGPDSVALLKALSMIADRYDLRLAAAHFNHGLRGEESEREEEFVRVLGRDMGIAVETGKMERAPIRRRGKSPEELYREARYDFLRQAAWECGANKIALGHHLQDQAETVLMNFLRGSGSEGLRGMLPVREGIFIRPLLQITREGILAFLEKEGLRFMTDSSNNEDFYLRNRIRRHLMPHLKTLFNPRMEETLARTAEVMRLTDEYVESEVEELLRKWGVSCREPEETLRVSEFRQLPEGLRYRLMKTVLSRMSMSGKGVGYSHVRASVDLAQGGRGSGRLDLPGGVLLRREYDMLIFRRKGSVPGGNGIVASGTEEREDFSYPLRAPGRVTVKEAGMELDFRFVERAPDSFPGGERRIVYMDYEAFRPPVVIRNMKPGDRIQPLGMTGTKKVKSYMIDEKVPRGLRHRIPLLVDGHSVLWIAGLRMSGRAAVTDKTRRVLKVEII